MLYRNCFPNVQEIFGDEELRPFKFLRYNVYSTCSVALRKSFCATPKSCTSRVGESILYFLFLISPSIELFKLKGFEYNQYPRFLLLLRWNFSWLNGFDNILLTDFCLLEPSSATKKSLQPSKIMKAFQCFQADT
jgi:hypothetical protein